MTGEPGTAAYALYRDALARGGDLPAAALSPADAPALATLLDQGLLARTGTGYTAVDPRAVGDRLGAELRTEATRLLLRAERLPAALAGLAHAYDAVQRPPAAAVGGDTRIEGTAGIRQHIAQLLSDCTVELLAAQPGARSLEGLQMARNQDLALLRRGGAIRTLYQPVAFADRRVADHVSMMAGHGTQVRVLNEPYLRMLVFDRSVAVIPAADDESRAAFVRNPAVVSHLVAVFERDWARAAGTTRAVTTPHPTTGRVGHLLRQGLTQRAIATRLHLSERSVAAHISRLRTRHGAQTLFQLGWQMRGEHDG
ncbi:LuxR family transcriptional regulator [Kitasatospora sp. NPDC047058]|uniref:LuxR family transcriptional regulator n=1 Tax=Kitasatospora sp. NPDC047058 TaxID=3155620 RepID=UPI0033E04761